MSRVADYDVVAPRYDRRYEDQGYRGIEQALLECLGEEEALDVLEVGCGTGHWLGVLATRVARIVGLDPSAGMLARARQTLPTVSLVRGRAEELPLATSSVDRVFCVNAFHHFGAKATFLTEAYRVLRAQGALMIVGLDPHTGRDSWWVYDYFHEVLALDKQRYPAAAEIRTTMARAGFRACETREVQRIERRVSAGAALGGDLVDRSVTSQLMILSEQEYQDGLDRIQSTLKAAAATGEDLMLNTDVRLYATLGWAA